MEENNTDIFYNEHNGKNTANMTNTENNFYNRFGDRLPTRDTKSRKGRTNYIIS